MLWIWVTSALANMAPLLELQAQIPEPCTVEAATGPQRTCASCEVNGTASQCDDLESKGYKRVCADDGEIVQTEVWCLDETPTAVIGKDGDLTFVQSNQADPPAQPEGAEVPVEPTRKRCGCASHAATPGVMGWIALMLLWSRRRRAN